MLALSSLNHFHCHLFPKRHGLSGSIAVQQALETHLHSLKSHGSAGSKGTIKWLYRGPVRR